MRKLIVFALTGALLIPLVNTLADDAVCVSVSSGGQTANGSGSFHNAGQSIVGVSTDGNVEVLAGTMYCMLVSGLSPTGDCNINLFVDLPDLPALTSNDCMRGPITPFVDLGCACSDFDENGHIDLKDAAGFQRAISH